MAELEELKKQAKQKIEAEMTEPDSPIGQIGMMCITWIDYADNAAELIMAEGKTLAGALDEIRKYAAKIKKGNTACVGPAKGMELVLEYFGQTDPIGVIEGGLMYQVLQDAMARFRPQYVEAKVVIDEEPPKSQPGADLMAALNALSLED